MNEEERKWREFEEYVKQVEEEQAQKQPDLYLQRSIGCLIGGILGPLSLIALVFVSAIWYPEAGGSSVAFFFWCLIAVPVGGVLGAVFSPFIARMTSSLARGKSK
jgi:hypothetical protein